MEKELFEKNLGNIAKLEVAFKEGSLQASVSMPVMELLDLAAAKVKAKIPGQVDDAIIDLIMKVAKEELSK